MQSIYIIAGEPSGDLHGGNLIKALKSKSPDLTIYCWGGEHMESAGGILRKHYKELAFMGFWEVIVNIRTIQKNFAFCKADILEKKPDAVVLIDYPGFNLRMAKWLKERGFKVIYYISPQVWAWKENRVKDIKKYVDKMFVILPFEKEFYKKWDYEVDYVGHPLLDAMPPISSSHNPTNIIALLPGSRKQEIEQKLPIFLKMIPHFPDYQFIIAGVTHLGKDYYQPFLESNACDIIYDDTYALLQKADAALVTSGTATLETALFKVPQVVCYKGNRLSYEIGKRLIKVPFIALVNLIMGRKIVEELIQTSLTEDNLVRELKRILDPIYREKLRLEYDVLRKKLGEIPASKSTAEGILKELKRAS